MSEPAFPGLMNEQEAMAKNRGRSTGYPSECTYHNSGLTKREYFAGQALQGFFSGIPFDSETPMTEADDKDLQEVARVCFKMADAMLAESQK